MKSGECIAIGGRFESPPKRARTQDWTITRPTIFAVKIGCSGDGNRSSAASTTEPLAEIGNVPMGQTVEIIVQAVNGSAQGQPSGALVITIPAARVVREAASNGAMENGASAPAKATLHNGNGNGKGVSHPRLTPA